MDRASVHEQSALFHQVYFTFTTTPQRAEKLSNKIKHGFPDYYEDYAMSLFPPAAHRATV